jgi:hypothetical protein
MAAITSALHNKATAGVKCQNLVSVRRCEYRNRAGSSFLAAAIAGMKAAIAIRE